MGSNFAHRRLRFFLILAILAVSGLTLSSFLARKRQRSGAQPLPPKIAADVNQQTQAFSLSKTLGGLPLYTVQASQVTNFKDTGKTILHHVSIDIFGKKGERRDHITSQECEFDAATGSLFIPGDVEMELDAPASDDSLAANQESSGPVHIHTSGLSFDQNTGIASTGKEVRFQFAGGEGRSQGAVYNPQDQSITLTARAQFTFSKPANGENSFQTIGTNPGADPPQYPAKEMDRSGGVTLDKEESMHVQAGNLRFRHGERKIFLGAPVEITQGTQRIEAGDSEILLDDQQRAQRVSLHGGVHGADRNPLGTAELRASDSEMVLNPKGKVKKLLLEGGASWATASAKSRKEGSAQRVEMFFDELGGRLSRVLADGQVRVSLIPSAGSLNAPLLRERPSDAGQPDGSQTLRAQQAEMILAADGETLREIRTRSASTIQIFPAKTGGEKRTVQGENFVMQFDPQGDLSEFSAEEHVRLSGEGAGQTARKRTTSSDHLWAAFDPRTHNVSRTRQWGNFHYQDPDRQAQSERADYTAEGDVTVLQGEPMVWNTLGKITAQKISLLNASSTVTAEGRVASTYFPPQAAGGSPPEPIHMVADRLEYNSKTEKALYQGKARMWQGSDLIEAGRMELDRQQQQLVAKDGVYSVFQGNPESQDQKPKTSAARSAPSKSFSGPVEIKSNSLVYKEGEHRALYQGEVRMQNASATLTSGEMEILFTPPASQNRNVPGRENQQIERAVATGNVVITEPTRKATGNRAEYLPQESQIILLGNLATVTDSQKGATQGARLTYFTGDDRISVEGGSGSPAETRRIVKP